MGVTQAILPHKSFWFIDQHWNWRSMWNFFKIYWKRSIEYCQFVVDGDADSYGKARDQLAEAFGEKYIVVKEECVGNVKKRLGSGLRELKQKLRGTKLSDGNVIGEKQRLTDKAINKTQNYFGEAVRNNVEHIESMENDIWAIFKHMIPDNSQSLDEQHSLWPRDSWCTHWSNREE